MSPYERAPRRLRLIVELTAHHYGIPVEDLIGRSRLRHLIDARMVVYRLVRDAGYSYPEIGKMLDRDHTTIMNACHKFREPNGVTVRKHSPQYEYEILRKKLEDYDAT